MQDKQNVSVLLVEDNEIDVLGVRRAFTRSNLDNPITVAADGREALEILRDGKSIARPYLILLDLNMPRMSGLEFLAEARSDDQLKSSIVFVLTTSNAPEDRAQAYRHNIAGYMVKGIGTDGFANVAALMDQYAQIVEFP